VYPELFRSSRQFQTTEFCRMTAEVAAEGDHQQAVLARASGRPNEIEVARDLRHCTFHQLSCWTMIAQDRDGPLTRLLPDSMGG